jgi:hypothetical protein
MKKIYNNPSLEISLSSNGNLVIDRDTILKRRSREEWQALDEELTNKIKAAMRRGANKMQINNVKMRHYMTTKCGGGIGESYTKRVRTIVTPKGQIYVVINHKFIKVTCNSKEQIKLAAIRTLLDATYMLGFLDDDIVAQSGKRMLINGIKALLGNIYPDWVFKDIRTIGEILQIVGFQNIKYIKSDMYTGVFVFIVESGVRTPEAIKLMGAYTGMFNPYFALQYYRYLKKAYKHSNVNVEMIMANRLAKSKSTCVYDVFYLFNEYNRAKREYKEKLMEFSLPDKFHKKDFKDAHNILAKLHRDMQNKLSYAEFDIPDAEKYSVTIEDYHFDVAKSSTELSHLSNICHNCVAGYTYRVQHGRSIILYGISEKSYPICIELEPISNKILQCYAPHNEKVDPENLIKCLKYFRQIGVDPNGWCNIPYVIRENIYDRVSGVLLFAAGQVVHMDMDFNPSNDSIFFGNISTYDDMYDDIEDDDMYDDIEDDDDEWYGDDELYEI